MLKKYKYILGISIIGFVMTTGFGTFVLPRIHSQAQITYDSLNYILGIGFYSLAATFFVTLILSWIKWKYTSRVVVSSNKVINRISQVIGIIATVYYIGAYILFFVAYKTVGIFEFEFLNNWFIHVVWHLEMGQRFVVTGIMGAGLFTIITSVLKTR